ncbi:MAG TPA: hypothetical protein VMG98_13805, partial [Verrucomicrobiae bacterium]|nr:hypothetical protein [Verrucomicrobiae bacterium]
HWRLYDIAAAILMSVVALYALRLYSTTRTRRATANEVSAPVAPQIIVRSRNPADISWKETEGLQKAIRAVVPDQTLEIVAEEMNREGYGYGITWSEIMDVILPAASFVGGVASKALIDEIVKVAVDWARARFHVTGGRRPFDIQIYGPDGKILRKVLVKDATAEPDDQTEQYRSVLDRPD